MLRSRALTWIVVAAAIGIAAAVIVFVLDRNPVHVPWLDDEDPAVPGVGAFRDNDSPALLVSSNRGLSRAAEGGDFESMDWSLGWINLLEQELGHYAHLDGARLGEEPWRGRQLVVIAHSAIDDLEAARLDSLAGFVASGGVLVLDRPTDRWTTLSGVRLGPPTASSARITRAGPDVLTPRVRKEIDRADLPFPVRLQPPATPPSPEVTELLAFDCGPGLLERRLGRGAVITAAFDLGRLLVTMQQGRPERDYRVKKRWGFYAHVLESHDLVWHERYLKSPVPAADVLERAVIAAVRRTTPLPAWWAFPDAAAGLLLMTHDEDEYGASMCRLLLEHEREIGVTSTYFLMAGRRMGDVWSDADVRTYGEAGADLALHWNRLPAVTGIWKAEPISRVFSLSDQVGNFRAAMAGGGTAPAPLLNRNHYLMWASPAEFASGDTHFTRTFRVMHGHGIVMDSTYGPNRGGRGYLFGTGRPFFPLDTDGTHFPIHEMPFVSQEDWDGEDEAWFARLFRESRELYHTAICCIFHPHIIVREEAGNRLWKSIYRLAAKHDHRPLTFRAYYEFLETRRKSTLRSLRRPDGTLEIRCTARGDGLTVAVPGHPDAAGLDGRRLTVPPPISVDGLPFTLIPVPAGPHVLTVRRPRAGPAR